MPSEEARGRSNGTGLARDSLLGRTSDTVSVHTGFIQHAVFNLCYTYIQGEVKDPVQETYSETILNKTGKKDILIL